MFLGFADCDAISQCANHRSNAFCKCMDALRQGALFQLGTLFSAAYMLVDGGGGMG
jgi:hypothetical protein